MGYDMARYELLAKINETLGKRARNDNRAPLVGGAAS
jgi:hypothetical protein